MQISAFLPIIISMKRVFSIMVSLILLSSLAAGIIPQSKRVGIVAVETEEGSVEEMLLTAFQEEFTLSWIERYTLATDTFLEAYSPLLSALLPMEDIVVGTFDGDGISLYSQKSGDWVYIIIKEGRIAALLVES